MSGSARRGNARERSPVIKRSAQRRPGWGVGSLRDGHIEIPVANVIKRTRSQAADERAARKKKGSVACQSPRGCNVLMACPGAIEDRDTSSRVADVTHVSGFAVQR
jgi:hypothetical protein